MSNEVCWGMYTLHRLLTDSSMPVKSSIPQQLDNTMSTWFSYCSPQIWVKTCGGLTLAGHLTVAFTIGCRRISARHLQRLLLLLLHWPLYLLVLSHILTPLFLQFLVCGSFTFTYIILEVPPLSLMISALASSESVLAWLALDPPDMGEVSQRSHLVAIPATKTLLYDPIEK